MPKSKSLQNKISKKLEKLSQLLDKINEAQVMNSDDSETWDSEALYNLVENLKEALKLLEGEESPKENGVCKNSVSAKQRDEFGSPLILEEGLCSLMDEYSEEGEDSKDF